MRAQLAVFSEPVPTRILSSGAPVTSMALSKVTSTSIALPDLYQPPGLAGGLDATAIPVTAGPVVVAAATVPDAGYASLVRDSALPASSLKLSLTLTFLPRSAAFSV